MKVLLVEPFGEGGIRYYADSLGHALAPLCDEVVLLTPRGLTARVVPGVRVRARLDVSRHPLRLPLLLRRARGMLRHTRNAAEIILEVIVGRYDIVHFCWPPVRFAAPIVSACRLVLPVVVTVHNVRPHDEATPAQLQEWRVVYSTASALVCHTEASASDLSDFLVGHEVPQVTVIPFPCGDTTWEPLEAYGRNSSRRRLGLPDGDPLLLFFGFIRPYKGLEMLLRAWAQARLRIGNAKLVIVGSCADWDPYERLIAELGIASSVIQRITWIDGADVPRYFASCDAVALPYSHIDASAVAAVGAYFGKPLLLNDIEGFRRMWGEYGSNMVAPDVAAWADVIARSMNGDCALENAAACAQERALRELTWEEAAKAHLALYESVTAMSRAGE